MEPKKLEWLKKEMKRWTEDGIITVAQCSQIEALYPACKAASPMLVLFAVLGSLLIGVGIILVFATNWWSLAVEVRLFLAFLPLLIGQGIGLYTNRRKYHSVSFREGCTVYFALRFKRYPGILAGDLFVASGVLLLPATFTAIATANILAMGLFGRGVIFIMLGVSFLGINLRRIFDETVNKK